MSNKQFQLLTLFPILITSKDENDIKILMDKIRKEAAETNFYTPDGSPFTNETFKGYIIEIAQKHVEFPTEETQKDIEHLMKILDKIEVVH